MIDIHASKAHVLRAVLLPLDCSRKQLTKLLALHEDTQSGFGERLDEYGVEALKATGGPDQPPVVESLHEIATFSAITALRVEFANPIHDTGYYGQYPEHSSERRMMTRPLRKHPGLSRFGEDIRDQYVYDVLYAFKHLAPESVQREVVAALLSPDTEHTESTPARPARTYSSENGSLESLHSRYVNRVEKRDESFKLPLSRVSARTFIEPIPDRLYLPSLELDNLEPIIRRGEHLIIPIDVVLSRLATVAYHGWYRLVNLAYQHHSESDIKTYIEGTPRVKETLRDHLKLRKPSRSFSPYYGAKSENPLVDPNATDPIARPDKRLITAADAIRGSSTLAFDTPILAPDLFDEICRFFPSPDRPSNDIGNKQTLDNAFDSAIDNRFTTSEMVASYEVPAPQLTPFFPRTQVTPWDRYRHQLANLASESITIPGTERISPTLPESLRPSRSEDYVTALQHADRTAVCEMKYDAERVETVQPLIDPDDVDELSAAECLFLTRVGLSMERRIRSYSLTQSMASFRTHPDGSPLDIDVEGLAERGYLSQPKTSRTYYSVPWKVRERLGIPNVSHDGWGERSPSEKTLHRVGIDLVAFCVASRSDVERVVRYCDVWRLQSTACWDDVSHLSKKRLDVVGFSDGEPIVVGEIETKTGDAAGTQGTVAKLDAFPKQIDRYLVTPNGNHLSTIMSRLSESDQFDIDVSRREKDGYRPAEVRSQLAEQGTIDAVCDDLLTYRNVRRRLPDQFDEREYADGIVGAI